MQKSEADIIRELCDPANNGAGGIVDGSYSVLCEGYIEHSTGHSGLDKRMLIDAIKGSSPKVELIGNFEQRGLGTFNGSHCEWNWQDASLKELDEWELRGIYSILRDDGWR